MASMLAVTDTHSLVWYADARRRNKLGRHALSHFRRADEGKATVYLSSMVLAEISELVHAGAIQLPHSFDRWLSQLTASPGYVFVPLTEEMVRIAHNLYAIPERGDRLIAATAIALDAPLITRDPEITDAAEVELLW